MVDVELKEDLTVDLYVVKLEDPCYSEEQEKAVVFDILTCDCKGTT